jgi:two-component system copper resistance phosphate regulon response regulator CusR
VKILIVEDEPKTGEYLRQGLNEAGFVADLASNGSDGLHLALHGEYDLVILDVMLPELDGWQVLASLRRRGLEMPVLFLTARDQVEDRVKGLELGADDYLVKPFSFAELWPVCAPSCGVDEAADWTATSCVWPIWSWTRCAAASHGAASALT